MRLRHVAPVFFGLFAALACGSSNDESKVEGGGSAATGNTGQAGGLIGIGNNGNGSGGSANGTGNGDPVDPGNACATSAADGEPVPVDLYFMVDKTGSMNCPVPDDPKNPCEVAPDTLPPGTVSRWSLVATALKAFMNQPANKDLGVGIRFFPQGRNSNTYCSVNTYTQPNVEIAPLSTNANRIVMSIDGQDPDGYTPTVPSITAAIAHAGDWAKANPDHKVVVVYATDGYPKQCGNNNTIPNAANVAKGGVDGAPSILTYVLGVGPNLDDLNTIAASGGTGKAFLVDTKGDAAAQLSAALATIRGNVALDCTYTIPAPPAGQTLEPGKVNVNYTDAAGAVTKVLQDPAGVTCDKGSGWQYSADGKQINLCGALCDKVKADPGGKLQVLFGCTTQIGEPPK